MNKNIIAILLFGFLIDCSSKNDDVAEDRIFYYTVSSSSPNESYLVDFLNKNMADKRVTITNESGQTWPFYYVLKNDEELPYDSLMPPHYYIHLLKEKKDNEIVPGDFFVDVRVMPVADTIPNFQLFIYQMDSTGLKLSATPRIHYIESFPSQDSAQIYDTILKSVIRYSFK